MREMLPLMDASGNINVHYRAELDIPVTFSMGMEDGSVVQENCAGAALFLEVGAGVLRKPLAADPGDTKGRRLQLTTAELNKIRAKAGELEYVIRDETGAFAFVRHSGRLRIYGG